MSSKSLQKKRINIHIIGTPSTLKVEIPPRLRAGGLMFMLNLVGWPLTIEYNDFPIRPMDYLDFLEDDEVIYTHYPRKPDMDNVLRFLRYFSTNEDKREGGE